MSLRVTLPLKFAEMGPTFTFATACISFSDSLSRLWHPGMHVLSTSGSFNLAQTTSRLAGSPTSPFIVIAIVLPPWLVGRVWITEFGLVELVVATKPAKNIG